MKKGFIIAIDGPSGAGKSSSSRQLASQLGYRYIDTGALYRIVGLLAWEQHIRAEETDRLATLCQKIPLHFVSDGADTKVLLDSRDITSAIRQPVVSQMASKVSAQPIVRQCLLTLQRDLGREGGVVMEGRDIGTVVFPDADIKFYLDASLEERGRRRHQELYQQGVATTIETTIREMTERDQRDSARDHAPLRRAVDAILIDTTSLSLAEVVRVMLENICSKRKCS